MSILEWLEQGVSEILREKQGKKYPTKFHIAF